MWVLEQMIDDICRAYETLPGGRDPLPRTDDDRPPMGNLAKFENKPYRVIWTLTGGSFGKAQGVGGPDGAIYDAIATFQVWIWNESLEACWNLMHDLIAVIKASSYGPNTGPLNFQAPTETEGRHMHNGELMTFSVNLAVPLASVGSAPDTLVELESHEATITEDNGEADEDGNFEAFETVIVTGPPAP